MKKYDSYKDSGVSWIGKIPDHWDQCRLKSYNSLKGRIGWNGLRSDEFLTEGYAYLVTGQDFSGRDIQWDKCYQIERQRYEEDPFIWLSNGDLLITKDGTIGKIATVRGLDKPACLNSGIFVMKQTADKYDQGYLFWLLSSDLLKEFNNYTSSGTTILHLYQNVFENMPMLIPPKDEQKAIATYLDHKCAAIDRTISTQEKKIRLLEKLKINVISSATFQGLYSAELKATGIAWMPLIPKHWKLEKISRVFNYAQIGSGTTPKSSVSDYYDENGYNWLQTGDLNDGIIIRTSKKVSSTAIKDYNLKFYPKQSIVIAMYGATIGKVGILGIETSTNQACCVLPPSKKCLSKFAFYYFIAAKPSLLIEASGGGQPNISQDVIRQHRIALPPIDEQQAIVHYLDNECAPIDAAIEKAHELVKQLKNYKQSLITEVVTGERKVC